MPDAVKAICACKFYPRYIKQFEKSIISFIVPLPLVRYISRNLKFKIEQNCMSEHVIENIRKYYLEMLPFNKVLGIDIKN